MIPVLLLIYTFRRHFGSRPKPRRIRPYPPKKAMKAMKAAAGTKARTMKAMKADEAMKKAAGTDGTGTARTMKAMKDMKAAGTGIAKAMKGMKAFAKKAAGMKKAGATTGGDVSPSEPPTPCDKYDGPHDEEDNIDELLAAQLARSSCHAR